MFILKNNIIYYIRRKDVSHVTTINSSIDIYDYTKELQFVNKNARLELSQYFIIELLLRECMSNKDYTTLNTSTHRKNGDKTSFFAGKFPDIVVTKFETPSLDYAIEIKSFSLPDSFLNRLNEPLILLGVEDADWVQASKIILNNKEINVNFEYELDHYSKSHYKFCIYTDGNHWLFFSNNNNIIKLENSISLELSFNSAYDISSITKNTEIKWDELRKYLVHFLPH